MERYIKKSEKAVLAVFIVFFLAGLVRSTDNQEGQKVAESAKVESRLVDIWSDGTRLTGDLFYPLNVKTGDKLPAVILCHGWGGIRSHLNQAYAPFLY